jgi:hypothetical protein
MIRQIAAFRKKGLERRLEVWQPDDRFAGSATRRSSGVGGGLLV